MAFTNNIITQFVGFVDGRLVNFVSTKAQAVMTTIEPTFVMCMGLYVVMMGFLYMTGKVEEPLMEFTKRVAKMAIVGTAALQMGQYNALVVETFQNSPQALATAFTGSGGDMAAQLNTMFNQLCDVVWKLYDSAGLTDPGPAIMAGMLVLVGGAMIAYTLFLIVLSKLVTGILLALGPVFIISMLFNATQRFFERWIAQLTNYGLVGVLTVAVNSFVSEAYSSYLTNIASGEVEIMMTVPIIVMSIVCVLIMGQITGIASGLAGGISLSSMGLGRMALRNLTSGASKAMDTAAKTTGLDRLNPMKRIQQRAAARDRVETGRHEERYKAKNADKLAGDAARNKELREAAMKRSARNNTEGSVQRTQPKQQSQRQTPRAA